MALTPHGGSGSGSGVTLHPAYKQAVRDLLADGFKHGDLIPKAWLWQHFQLVMPGAHTPNHVAEAANLKFLAAFKKFEKELLENHRMMLRNDRGVGWQIVRASEQTRLAFREGMREVGKELTRMSERLVYVDQGQLSGAQKKENADALAKAANLKTLLAKTRRLPKP